MKAGWLGREIFPAGERHSFINLLASAAVAPSRGEAGNIDPHAAVAARNEREYISHRMRGREMVIEAVSLPRPRN